MRPCGEDRAGKTLRQPCLDVPFVRGRPLRQDACDVFGRRRGCWEVARPRGKGAFIAPWAWRQRSVSTEVLGAASVPVDANRILTGRTAESPPTATCSIK